ncbi:MAG: RluA family pseudouridine synthase [Armatimonadetes bacterium]|nr:RluA family pseudouridine synthase [Armatimonadota bacterium]
MELVADRKERLDLFLKRHLPEHSRTKLAGHITAGRVSVDGSARKPGFPLERGMKVSIGPIEPTPSQDLAPVPMDLDIAYEDEHLLVVNKPASLIVHPSASSNVPTLVHALLARSGELSNVGGEFRPGIVHRLDKDTSGLMLVAKSDSVHRKLQEAIQNKEVARIYRVWVKGVPDQTEFSIRSCLGRHPKNRKKMAVVHQSALDARLAITHCRVVESKRGITELECRLDTGRTHQIRVHLSSVGLPVLGDQVYGITWPGHVRQALHAARLILRHPVTGVEMDVRADIPEDIGEP